MFRREEIGRTGTRPTCVSLYLANTVNALYSRQRGLTKTEKYVAVYCATPRNSSSTGNQVKVVAD